MTRTLPSSRAASATAAALLLVLCAFRALEPVEAQQLRKSRGETTQHPGDTARTEDDNGRPTDDVAARGEKGPCSPNSSSAAASVRIYDDVVPSPTSRQALIEFAELHNQMKAWKNDGETTSFFSRSEQSSPLERVIDTILIELGDENEHVEYWSRDEHINLNVHADINEGAEDFVYPESSHVLYLGVQPGHVAPTVIFPDRLLGWDGDGWLNAQRSARRRRQRGAVEMVSVPAVEGRLLKFDGRVMHGVPRPYDRWITEWMEDDDSDVERYVPPNYDYEDDLDSSALPSRTHRVLENYQRSVLIFNTWSELPANAKLWRDIKAAPLSSPSSHYLGEAPVRLIDEDEEDPFDENNDDDDDDDATEGEYVSEAERFGGGKFKFKDIHDTIERIRTGKDTRITEAEENIFSKWGEEFGQNLEGMGPTERTAWREVKIDCSGSSTGASPVQQLGSSEAVVSIHRRLAEMEEAMEEVAGIPILLDSGALSSPTANTDGRTMSKGEVLEVELMGMPFRRLHPFRTVKLRTDPSNSAGGTTARKILGRSDRPAMMVLHEGKCD